MNQVNQLQNAIRRSVSEHYLDLEGGKQTRASSTDFETLPSRHIKVIFNLPGFQEDNELVGWIGYSRAYNETGKGKAVAHLKY